MGGRPDGRAPYTLMLSPAPTPFEARQQSAQSTSTTTLTVVPIARAHEPPHKLWSLSENPGATVSLPGIAASSWTDEASFSQESLHMGLPARRSLRNHRFFVVGSPERPLDLPQYDDDLRLQHLTRGRCSNSLYMVRQKYHQSLGSHY